MQTHFSFAKPATFFLTALVLCLYGQMLRASEGGLPARITVGMQVERPIDTLYLMKTYGNCFKPNTAYPTLRAVAGQDGKFHFEVPVESPDQSFIISRRMEKDTTEHIFKLQLHKSNESLTITPRFYLFPGDRVHLEITKARPGKPLMASYSMDYNCAFSGTDSERYAMQFKIDSLLPRRLRDGVSHFDDNFVHHCVMNARKPALLAELENRRSKMSDFHYKLLKTDILFSYAEYIFDDLERYCKYRKLIFEYQSFRQAYEKLIAGMFPHEEFDGIHYSQKYIDYLVEKNSFEVRLRYAPDSPAFVFDRLAELYSGPLRDRALLAFLTGQGLNYSHPLYAKALSIVQDKDCRTELETRIRLTSSPVADIALPDAAGNLHSLAGFPGKWVFVDLWFTGCAGCKQYYNEVLKYVEKKFEDAPGIQFISVSVDKNKALWLKSVEQEIYSSQRALNLYTAGKGYVHEVLTHHNINSFPTILVIAPDGMLVAINPPELKVLDPEKVIAHLNNIMADKKY